MKYQFTSIALLGCLFSSLAFAGPGVNNGGGGWACRSQKTKQYTWIKTLEISVLEEQKALQSSDNLTADEIFDNKMKLIKEEAPSLQGLLNQDPIQLNKAIHYVQGPLGFIPDGHLDRKPSQESCQEGIIEYVQLADYLIDGTLLIDNTLWNDPAFNATNKAALLLHELVYKTLRDVKGRQTSSSAQYIIQQLFRVGDPKDLDGAIQYAIDQVDSNGEPMIIPYAFHLFCYASVVFSIDAQKPPLLVSLRDLKQLDNRDLNLGGFNFSLETNPIDGRPWLMQITDTASNVTTEMDHDLLFTEFLVNKKVSVSLRHKNVAEATFSCEASQ